MELNREHFRVIIFYNLRHGLTQQQCIVELNSIFGDEAPSRTSGMVNSSGLIVHSKMNFVKAVQNQLLFRKPLILRANWYCNIVMLPTVRLRHTQHTFNIAWPFDCRKKFVRFGFHTICLSLKKINQSEWQKFFDNWFKRMQNCIDLNREYFEKQ